MSRPTTTKGYPRLRANEYRPLATEINRSDLISIYMHIDGLTFGEAIQRFKRENRRLWMHACATP